MEELMPWGVGALTAVSVRAALDIASPAGSRRGEGRVHSDVLRLRALALARRLGGWVHVPARVERVVDAWAAEAAHLAAPLVGPAARERTAARGTLYLQVAAGALLGFVVALSPWGLLVGAVAPAAVCASRAARRARETARRVEAAMPEAFQALAISLGSGHSLAQALRFVGAHAEEPLRSAFLEASLEITCGVPAHEALQELLRRLPAPGLGLVTTALAVSQRTGAPLRDLLGRAAGMVGERIELARRLEVKTAQARLSARLVTAMPVVLMGALTLLSPDFRAGIASVAGALSVVVALALDAVAWLIIRKIMEVKV
ncbi:type II secretion system F family protein [Collinsella sp. An268]|uniref:type II secretion system F family protein n=1 Tax=Collinsella sp. An268 TaxID=1965612 RepID=UPI000B376049|nr:type II secretion system F family protein [Collinsella sp. An268]OUO64136.1 hypothetical protein B5F70_05935 [Collinsella sp. An268]